MFASVLRAIAVFLVAATALAVRAARACERRQW